MNREQALTELRRARDALDALEVALAADLAPAPVQPPAQRTLGLADPAKFFAAVRGGKALGPVLTAGEVSGCEAILKACDQFPRAWAAYALATAVVETASTMQPIKEYGGQAYFRRMYDIEGDRPAKARELGNLSPGDGAKYCGRGYVQLTGKANYVKAGKALGVPLEADPDLALQPAIAASIMREGMNHGWFTGKSLSTYLPGDANLDQFAAARRIINGQDRAAEIAQYALHFQSALLAGGWA